MVILQESRSTRSSQLDLDVYRTESTAQATVPIQELSDVYAGLTGAVRVLDSTVESGRRAIRSLDLDERTAVKATSSVNDLLEVLAVDWGLAWSEIARLCGVTVSAVRKWRMGESVSPDNRRALARLAAFLELLEVVGPVGDAAGWLGMRLSERYTVTASDLYSAGHADDVLEYAQGQLGLNDLLERWEPDWRATNRSEWMIVNDPEAGRVLARRD